MSADSIVRECAVCGHQTGCRTHGSEDDSGSIRIDSDMVRRKFQCYSWSCEDMLSIVNSPSNLPRHCVRPRTANLEAT